MSRTNILEELEMLKDSQCFCTVSYSDDEIVLFFFFSFFLNEINKHAVLQLQCGVIEYLCFYTAVMHPEYRNVLSLFRFYHAFAFQILSCIWL